MSRRDALAESIYDEVNDQADSWEGKARLIEQDMCSKESVYYCRVPEGMEVNEDEIKNNAASLLCSDDEKSQQGFVTAGNDVETVNVYDEVAVEAEEAEVKSAPLFTLVAETDSKKAPASCEFCLNSFNLHCHTSNATLSHVIHMLKLKDIFANAGPTIHV